MGLPSTVLGIPDTKYLGTPCLVGQPGTVLGIPGYLVSRDPWDSTPGGTTQDTPGYTRILNTSWVCDTGVSHVSRDVTSCPGTSCGSTGHPWRQTGHLTKEYPRANNVGDVCVGQ